MDDGDDDGDGEASDDIAPVAEDDGHDDGGEDDEVDGDNDAEDANAGVGMPMGGGGMAGDKQQRGKCSQSYSMYCCFSGVSVVPWTVLPDWKRVPRKFGGSNRILSRGSRT